MKRQLAALALVAMVATPLGGCDTVRAVLDGQSVAQIAPVTLADAEKKLTIAHNGVNYISAQLIYNATPPPDGSGLIHGTLATTLRGYYAKAIAALKLADDADDAANTQSILSNVANAQTFIDDFKALAATSALKAPPGLTPPAN